MQGGGAWPRLNDVTLNDVLHNDVLHNDVLHNDVLHNDVSPNDVPPRDLNSNCYLLTGYDVYLSREPCCMCAMALVHSRAGRIFYFGAKNEIRKFGALETAVKLNAVEGLNHSYDVFCIERN